MNMQNYNTGIQDIPDKKILILGCGNILFGDDGFGPYVAEELRKNYKLPENAGVINAGSAVRSILFDIALSEKKPEKIIIIDAIDAGKTPGEIFELPIFKASCPLAGKSKISTARKDKRCIFSKFALPLRYTILLHHKYS